MRRLALQLLAAGVLLSLGAIAVPALLRYTGFGSGRDVPTCEVARRDFVRRVRADGNLEAATATPLGPPPGGQGPLKIAWLAPDGSQVAAGDVVIRFDPTELEQEFAEGQAERTTAELQITQKEVGESSTLRNLERDSELAELELRHAREFRSKDPEIFSRNDIIESEIDQDLAAGRREHAEALRGLRSALADVELDLLALDRRKAELKIDQARRGLEQLEVRAPHDGIVVLERSWDGETPQVGTVVWGGNKVAEIPRPDTMEAEIYVLEADAGGLAPGLVAELRIDAHPMRVYRATVQRVDTLAKRRFRRVPVQYFGVRLALDGTDPAVMKPGQRVQTVLHLDERPDALVVPRQAVFEREGKQVVYRPNGRGFEPSEVQLGPSALGLVVVVAGLAEGDVVALRDPTRPAHAADAEPAQDSGPAGLSVGSPG